MKKRTRKTDGTQIEEHFTNCLRPLNRNNSYQIGMIGRMSDDVDHHTIRYVICEHLLMVHRVEDLHPHDLTDQQRVVR